MSATVTVTRKLPDLVEARLRDHFAVRLNPEDAPFSPARLVEALREACSLLPCSGTPFP